MPLIENRPLKTLSQLLEFYNIEDVDTARDKLPFVQTVMSLKAEIVDNINTPIDHGQVYAIRAPWGSGKTTFVNILRDELLNSAEINKSNFCWYFYDTLYYGNVSESTNILISGLFKQIEQTFAVKLQSSGRIIAKNLTPKVDVVGLIPKLSFSYNSHPDSGLVLSGQLMKELIKIRGKIIVVIDDIDRLTSTEALHMLRLVRVLKELPNTYIFIPVDYDALVKMLKSEKIASPGAYVRKIFDETEVIEPRINEAFDLFKYLVLQKMPSGFVLNEEPLKDLWLGYLWEASLAVIRRYEFNPQTNQRFVLSTAPGVDPWPLLEPVKVNQTSLVQEVFNRTRRQYDSQDNYMVRLNPVAQNPGNVHLLGYSRVAGNATFSQFIEGDYNTKAQFPDHIPMSTRDMFSIELYNESNIQHGQAVNPNDDGDIAIASALVENATSVRLWDIIRSLPEQYFPKPALPLLTSRTIKKLVDELAKTHTSEVQDYIQNNKTGAIDNLYRKTKNTIGNFINENIEVD